MSKKPELQTSGKSVDRDNVIRPSLGRWLLRRREESTGQTINLSGDSEVTGNVSVDVQQLDAEIASERVRFRQLENTQRDLQQQQSIMIKRTGSLEFEVVRSNHHLSVATTRMNTAGEPLPEISTSRPSMLQESYLNFFRCVRLLEKKHQRVSMKVDSLNTQHDEVQAELDSINARLQSLYKQRDGGRSSRAA